MNNCCPNKKWMNFFKAACDEHRQMILEILRRYKSLNANEIVGKMHLSQPTISHHLKILCEASLINAKREGKEIHYSLNSQNIKQCCCGFMDLFSPKKE
jgi:ArsR family transcriptional regulator, arsenate/arsenite/antimonite-responsive transcriptional repressor